MRKSYIANSAEALNLYNGTQTAIVVKMKVQPTPPKAIYRQDDCKVIISDNAVLQGGLYASRVLWNCNKHPHIKDCTTWQNNLPYQIGQEVYVRESCCPCNTEDGRLGYAYKDDEYAEKFVGWQSPVTMPKHAARTRFKIVGGDGVRVKDDIGYGNATKILEFDYSEGQQFKNYEADWNKYNNSQFQFGDYRDGWQSYIISRFGQSSWDNNDYIWYYNIENI